MSSRLHLVLAALLLVTAAGAQLADPLPPADRFLYLPPTWADRVVFYHSFDGTLDRPDINDLGATLTTAPTATGPGFAGQGCPEPLGAAKKHGYEIASDGLSPHRPLTMMCWLRLETPVQETTWYNLLRLWRGDTYLTHFVAGKGEWCGLQRPTYIFQVVNFPGLPLYHNSWAGSPDWQPGEWHHVAMTVSGAANVRFYRDGKLVENILLKTRPFREGEVRIATFGDGKFPMTVDEVIVADRALQEDELADYVAQARQLHAIGYAPLAAGLPGAP